jgi:glycine dehydrogenase subunit 2
MRPRPLVFELDQPGRRGVAPPPPVAVTPHDVPARWRRGELPLPSVSELDVVRHYTVLSKDDFGVETGMFPLGSCTMKYNPLRSEARDAREEVRDCGHRYRIG